MNGTDDRYSYVGTELDLFAGAVHWKSYLARQIQPYLGPEVLELGAGIGATTRYLCRGTHTRWVCLEPDPDLAVRLTQAIEANNLPACCKPAVGTLVDSSDLGEFDTLLYIDVLEHIEDDRDELVRAAGRLKSGGHLVVLSPAHPWLYTPFDAAIGHYRRYTKQTMKAVAPDSLELVRLRYLDAVGMAASLANRVLLRQAMPSRGQIALWDNIMVRLSRLVDPVLGYALGKSVLGVWKLRHRR
jgi:2-polyprenyl-3-methyl-5-hydroxy-6-metoxy-1,4-benzoquinol methylase